MEIDVNRNAKLLCLWLTNAEKNDAALRERLKPLYRMYREQSYAVAVFESGREPLEALTGELLRCNRRRMAALAVQTERALGAPARI